MKKSVHTLILDALREEGRELLALGAARRYSPRGGTRVQGVRLPRETAARLERMAEAEGCSVNALLLDLLALGAAVRGFGAGGDPDETP